MVVMRFSIALFVLLGGLAVRSDIFRLPCGQKGFFISDNDDRPTAENSDVLHETSTATEIQCARLCLRHQNCTQFVFADGTCQLYGKTTAYRTDKGKRYRSQETGERCAVCLGKAFVESCECAAGFYGNRCQHVSRDCYDVYTMNTSDKNGFTSAWIQPSVNHAPFQVSCFSWNPTSTFIFIRKQNSHSQSFTRTWSDYKHGFGTVGEAWDYWLGLEKIYQLVSNACYTLRFDVRSKEGHQRFPFYTYFKIGDEASGYRITLTQKTPFDSLTPPDAPWLNINGSAFTTFDVDNDSNDTHNCAKLFGGGWWYNNCADALPTARFAPPGESGGKPFITWPSVCTNCTLTHIDVKIIRVGDSPC